MAAKTHLALVQDEAKGPLVLRSVPTVPPGKGQILIKVKVAGLNPVDYKQLSYGHYIAKFPHIGGFDLSGVVVEVGEGITHVKEGDRIASAVFNFIEPISCAAFQEYSTSNAIPAVKIPDTLSFSQAATIPCSYYTAILGVAYPTLLNLQWPGDPFPTPNPTPILVWGGGSGVGRNVVQILKAANYSNIIVTAAPYRFDDLKSIGAKAVFNYKDADVVEQIQKYLGDEKLLYSYDAISSEATLIHLVKLVSPGGTIGTVNPEGLDILPREGSEIKRAGIDVAIIAKPEGLAFFKKAGEYLQKFLESGSYSVPSYQDLPGGLEGGGVQKGSEKLRLNENHSDRLVVSGI